MAFQVGDRVWYVLGRAPGRPRPLFVAAVVVRIGGTRVGIQLVDGSPPRYVAPSSITTTIPVADVELVTSLRPWSAWNG